MENYLLAHPRVAAAVVAVSDVRMGEKACAFLVPHGAPTTMTGKVQKFLLRDQARAAASQ